MIILKRLKVANFKLLRQLDLFFPRQGSILVEGLNESGKSTLFESVFFALYGVPLVTEGRGRGNLESVIRYEAESAAVDLLLEVGGTELEIHRVVARGKSSQASLVVRPVGMREEQIVGVLAVNARVVEELGGLDGEALLNSCFVEQKKLSKLEDLAGGQRKDSLRRLLNLERLTELAERFKVTGQDERALAEARARLEMAEVMAQLPEVVSERTELEAALRGSHRPDASFLRRQRRETNPRPTGNDAKSDTVGRGLVPRHQAPDARSAARDESSPHLRNDMLDGDEMHWAKAAVELAKVRGVRASTRRRGIVSLAAGVLPLALAAGLFASGLHAALWALPLVVALIIFAVMSFRSASQLSDRADRLAAELALQRDGLVAKIGELEGRKARLEAEVRGQVADLDLEECRRRVETLVRRMEVNRRAAALVEGAMERIVRMVLPNTERNLGQILPMLTVGRYHEARIGEDYQIKVWDDAAGRYVSKSVFSGGARDQFSLALRLSFALATLPQELGATPGFLFLDEPLSSFDGPRTEALVQLLTAGQVGENFSQIFVISHNRSFDVGAFQYRIVMRDGRVVESNLL